MLSILHFAPILAVIYKRCENADLHTSRASCSKNISPLNVCLLIYRFLMPHELFDRFEGGLTDVAVMLIDQRAKYLIFYFERSSNMNVEVRYSFIRSAIGSSRAAKLFILIEQGIVEGIIDLKIINFSVDRRVVR